MSSMLLRVETKVSGGLSIRNILVSYTKYPLIYELFRADTVNTLNTADSVIY